MVSCKRINIQKEAEIPGKLGRKQKPAFYPLAWKDLKPSLACQKRAQVQITLFPLLILPPVHRCSVSNTNFEAPKPFQIPFTQLAQHLWDDRGLLLQFSLINLHFPDLRHHFQSSIFANSHFLFPSLRMSKIA